ALRLARPPLPGVLGSGSGDRRRGRRSLRLLPRLRPDPGDVSPAAYGTGDAAAGLTFPPGHGAAWLPPWDAPTAPADSRPGGPPPRGCNRRASHRSVAGAACLRRRRPAEWQVTLGCHAE